MARTDPAEPQRRPFADLPAALVDDVLNQAGLVGDALLNDFRRFRETKHSLRNRLDQQSMLLSESSLGYPPQPTTCAADGSYAIERLLTTDFVAAAAVAVEGLTPPSEERHWDQPRHATFVAAERHEAETATVLRAVMLGNELVLAQKAPHDLVMIDGTLTLPIIYLNQALNKPSDLNSLQCADEFDEHCTSYLDAYLDILRSERSDKNYIGLPKYSTRREICTSLGCGSEHDDRGLLTLVLEAGELTRPMVLEQPAQNWHLNTSRLTSERRSLATGLTDEIVAALGLVHVFYYRPHDWLPALRIETSARVAKNPHRLASVVQGLKYQCATAGMLEPYPIYLADRTVKALARSIPAFRQIATQRISESYEGDIGEVFFGMHGYRTESGA